MGKREKHGKSVSLGFRFARTHFGTEVTRITPVLDRADRVCKPLGAPFSDAQRKTGDTGIVARAPSALHSRSLYLSEGMHARGAMQAKHGLRGDGSASSE